MIWKVCQKRLRSGEALLGSLLPYANSRSKSKSRGFRVGGLVTAFQHARRAILIGPTAEAHVTFVSDQPYSGNESARSGSYLPDLRCANDRIRRSSVSAHSHQIRTRKIRRFPNPSGYRKHNHPGRPHARRTLCRQTEHKCRALLVAESRLVLS